MEDFAHFRCTSYISHSKEHHVLPLDTTYNGVTHHYISIVTYEEFVFQFVARPDVRVWDEGFAGGHFLTYYQSNWFPPSVNSCVTGLKSSQMTPISYILSSQTFLSIIHSPLGQLRSGSDLHLSIQVKEGVQVVKKKCEKKIHPFSISLGLKVDIKSRKYRGKNIFVL